MDESIRFGNFQDTGNFVTFDLFDLWWFMINAKFKPISQNIAKTQPYYFEYRQPRHKPVICENQTTFLNITLFFTKSRHLWTLQRVSSKDTIFYTKYESKFYQRHLLFIRKTAGTLTLILYQRHTHFLHEN